MHLRALSHLAPKNDRRHWFNGVWVESLDGFLYLIATNGAATGVIDAGPTDAEPFTALIPHSVLAALPKKDAEVTITSDDGKAWQAQAGTTSHRWAMTDEALPDWRRAVPATTTGLAAQYDPALIAAFAKTCETLGHKAIGMRVAHNNAPEGGGGASLVSIPDTPEFIGVLMSLRYPADTTKAPDWVRRNVRPVPQLAEPECDLA